MFIKIAEDNLISAKDLLTLHPEQLANLMESVWIQAERNGADDRGSGNRQRPQELASYVYTNLRGNPASSHPTPSGLYAGITLDNQNWDHLIYAYMIENTRIYQIFQEVIRTFFEGEKLDIPSPEGQAWLRNTEMLFYNALPGFYSFNLRSQLRPDEEASRRNIYYRMFGMDLNHGTSDNKPYPFVKANEANRDFVAIFERFLQEAYRGIINLPNTSGANSSDYASISDLAGSLANMLQVRRQHGNLSREEFYAVAMMSWFHLTLKIPNAPILLDLKANGNSPEDRLIQIGKKVGIPAHAKSRSLFSLADNLSLLLLAIEGNEFDTSVKAKEQLLGPPYVDTLKQVIAQWSIATGRDIRGGILSPQKRIITA